MGICLNAALSVALYTQPRSASRAALTLAHSDASTLKSTGTASARPYTFNTAAAKLASRHAACLTSRVPRPGRTNACVTTLTSPNAIPFLHFRQRARRVGAKSIKYDDGLALNVIGAAAAYSTCRNALLHSEHLDFALVHKGSPWCRKHQRICGSLRMGGSVLDSDGWPHGRHAKALDLSSIPDALSMRC